MSVVVWNHDTGVLAGVLLLNQTGGPVFIPEMIA
jgi:hypothetical protein